MSQAISGTCCVCGKETNTRCQACGKAGIDLFFCSSEHQKLVWFAHKEVCGPGKANPFVWPPLTPQEADEARKLLDVRFEIRGRTCASLTEQLAFRLPHLKPAEVKDILTALSSKPLTAQDASFALRQFVLCETRGFVPMYHHQHLDRFPPAIQVLHHTSNMFATMTKNLDPLSLSLPEITWVAPLLHQLLIAYAVQQLLTPQSRETIAPLLIGTTEVLRRLVHSSLLDEDPSAAEEVRAMHYKHSPPGWR